MGLSGPSTLINICLWLWNYKHIKVVCDLYPGLYFLSVQVLSGFRIWECPVRKYMSEICV